MNLSNIAINEENALQVMLHTKIWTAIIMFVLPLVINLTFLLLLLLLLLILLSAYLPLDCLTTWLFTLFFIFSFL